MKFLDKLSMAYKDLLNRKGRSILTILAVAIGALLLIVLLGVGDGVVAKMKEVVESFGDINAVYVYPMDASEVGDPVQVNMGGGSSEIDITEVEGEESIESKSQNSQPDNYKKLAESDLSSIKDVEGVKKIYVAIQGSATSYKVEGKDYIDKSVQVVGENLEYDENHGDQLISGSEISNKADDILIAENLIKKLGFDDKDDIIGKKVTVKVETPMIEGMEGLEVKKPLEVTGTVVGILDRKEFANCIIMDQKKAEPLLGYFDNTDNYIEDQGYSGVKVVGNDGVNGTKLAKKIQDATGFTCVSYSMISDIFNSVGSFIKGILSIGGIIVLVVAGLGLVNTVTMILQEKRKMIGVMRSVGGAKSDIKSIFLMQSIIIGVAGCIVGAILSAAGIVFTNEFITKSSGFVISVSPYNIGIALIITFLISLIAGVIPANKAAKLNVVQAVAEE